MILFSVLAALADMWRGNGQWTGDKLPNKRIGLLIVGLCYVAVVGSWTWWVLPYLIWLNIAGVAFGTGNPMARVVLGNKVHLEQVADPKNDLENFQRFFGVTNHWWSQALLGFLWHVPALFMWSIDPAWVFVPFINAITFPLSGWIARRKFAIGDRWKAMEGLRSGIAVFFLAAAML